MTRWNFAEKIALAAFLFWSAAGLVFTLFHISSATIAGWHLSPPLLAFVLLCLDYGDPILILLAFLNTHLHAAQQWQPGVARLWAFLIIAASFGAEYIGCHSGVPFGPYTYTDKFGPTVLGVPFIIPLAWHVVLTNCLFIIRALAPGISTVAEALFAAFLCTTYDFILEPFATTVKHYWTWAGSGDVPVQNYAAWFFLSGVLIWSCAPTYMTRFRYDPRPWLVLGGTIVIFVAGYWAA